MRLVASLQHYLATNGDTLYVHQYAGAQLSGAGLDVEIDTDYPWSGVVTSGVLAAPRTRGLALRIPAWCASARISLNNPPEDATRWSPRLPASCTARWRAGDEIAVRLDVTPRWTHPTAGGRGTGLRGDRARAAASTASSRPTRPIGSTSSPSARARRCAERATADGVGATIQVIADGGHGPGSRGRGRTPDVPAIAIPYFQWDNRGPGMMRVWIPRG